MPSQIHSLKKAQSTFAQWDSFHHVAISARCQVRRGRRNCREIVWVLQRTVLRQDLISNRSFVKAWVVALNEQISATYSCFQLFAIGKIMTFSTRLLWGISKSRGTGILKSRDASLTSVCESLFIFFYYVRMVTGVKKNKQTSCQGWS